MQIDALTSCAGIPIEIDFAEIRRQARIEGEKFADFVQAQPHEREEVIRRMADCFVRIVADSYVEFYGARDERKS